MERARVVVALMLATLGGQVVVMTAQPRAASLFAPAQTIRIQPVDSTHVRLRLEGRENWIVDSAGFSIVPDVDFVRVVATPGRNAVTAAGRSRVAQTFELSIAPSGSLRIKAP
jgi:hypothetical protein